MKKNSKYWKRRLGNLFAHDIPPYWFQLDLRPVTDLNDEGLEFILSHIKGVKTIYLNGTSITNQAINLLGRLEYLNELHLANNKSIDANCILHLGMIKGLEILNISHTAFLQTDISGLSQISSLKEIFLHDDSISTTLTEEMKTLYPGIIFHFNTDPGLAMEMNEC